MPDNDFLQGAQIGLGIAQQWAARSARDQELRIQEAYRRMQERQLAAQAQETAAHTLILNQQAKKAVEEESAMKQGQIDMATDMELLGTSPQEAFFKHMAPAIIRFHPDKASGVMMDAALMPYKVEAEKALAKQRNASAGLSDTRSEEIKTEAWLGSGKDGLKPTALSQNADKLTAAKTRLRTAYDALMGADTDADKAVAQKEYTNAKDALDALNAFSPHANDESKQAAAVVKAKALADSKVRVETFKSLQQTLHNQQRALFTEHASASNKQKPKIESQIESVQSQLDGLASAFASGAELKGAPKAAPQPMPLPSDRTKWRKGQPYNTNKGLLIWDGEHFVTPP